MAITGDPQPITAAPWIPLETTSSVGRPSLFQLAPMIKATFERHGKGVSAGVFVEPRASPLRGVARIRRARQTTRPQSECRTSGVEEPIREERTVTQRPRHPAPAQSRHQIAGTSGSSRTADNPAQHTRYRADARALRSNRRTPAVVTATTQPCTSQFAMDSTCASG